MDSNNILLLVIGIISFFLSRKYVNTFVLMMVGVTFLVGLAVTKKILVSLSISLILTSMYTMFFLKNIETYEEYKKSKEN